MTSISTRAEVFPPGEHYVRDELDERGGTKEELAEILDRPVQTVSGILNGRKQTPPHLGRAGARLSAHDRETLDVDAVVENGLDEGVGCDRSGEMPMPQWRVGARREAPVGASKS